MNFAECSKVCPWRGWGCHKSARKYPKSCGVCREGTLDVFSLNPSIPILLVTPQLLPGLFPLKTSSKSSRMKRSEKKIHIIQFSHQKTSPKTWIFGSLHPSEPSPGPTGLTSQGFFHSEFPFLPWKSECLSSAPRKGCPIQSREGFITSGIKSLLKMVLGR